MSVGSAPLTTLGSYRIERQLGRGGMGTVYLAYNTTLHRNVALKVLDGQTEGEKARDRLLREARNAAALNHPNICTVYEVGEASGLAFIAMEYVGGRSLRDRIDEGALPLGEVLRLGIQAADALAYAHDHGVVHRDLKAANVIVADDGRLRVVDFGLARRDDARVAEATTMMSLVSEGVVAGTPYAMAPEQVRGEDADKRTDVWALGVLLYEMAARRQPFAATSVPELFSTILRDDPPALPDRTPIALRAIIERCLEKDSNRRYQSAGEVRASLEAVQADAVAPLAAWRYYLRRRRWLVSAAAAIVLAALAVGLNVFGVRERVVGRNGAAITLAVLPFQNLTGDPEQEYFSDGLTDEMITQLGRLQPQRLSVIARTSSMRYKGRDVPIDQIARELGVNYVMEGSARRQGNRVRISATLVDARNQTQRWSDSFERELSNVLSLQSDIARGVAQTLSLQLLPQDQNRLAANRTVNPEAYEAYLKGRFHWQTMDPNELDVAMSYFEQAVQKDPGYALPYTGMGTVFGLRCNNGRMRCLEALAKWKEVVLKAKSLDPTLPQVQSQLAAIAYFVDWDWPAAEREFRRAIEVDPTDADTRMWYASFLVNVADRADEGVAEARRAVELDPQNALYRIRLAVTLLDARRDDEGIAVLQAVKKSEPNMRSARINLTYALAGRGRYREALAELAENNPANREIAAAREEADAEAAFRKAARIRPDNMVRQAQTTYVSPAGIAGAYARAREPALALDWLEKAYDEHEPIIVDLRGRTFDVVRGEPRYEAILRRAKLSNER
jgi:TolB-like protein/predicted Ser/Thr protein kinase